jgi:hypothetical protein
MFHYWGYGLTIASEIEFPELLPFDFETADVTIHLGKTPEILTGANVINRVGVCISPTEYLFKFLNTAKYYTANGNSIIVEPMPGTDYQSVRLFVLSNAMAAILHQRDTICLHASAIEYGEGVVLFCGISGAGKSTTATMLQQKGYKVISDDVCVLKAEGDFVTSVPSYPMMKLWEDSFEKTGVAKVDDTHKIRPQLPKYARFFHQDFDITPHRVKKIFVLDVNTSHEVSVSPVSLVNAFKELQKNTYRPVQMNAMQKRSSHFAIVSKLTTAAKIYKITRPHGVNTLEKVTGLIIQQLNGHD